MAIQATDTTFNTFLNPQEDKIYMIPIYQREYSWGEKHCEALVKDIEENEGNNYFIGSIIWVKDVNEIIDGQQRLTSLNLLLTALYNKMNSFESNEDINFIKTSLKRMLVVGDKCRLVPQRQGKNKEDFEYLINSEILKKSAAKPNNYGNRRISHNYEWFKSYVELFDEKMLSSLFNKICGLTFISARVDDAQTAFTLFETMNNRGMPLSAIDLIKNSYLSRSKDESRVNNWEELIAILGDENNQEQFLRNNYNAFRAEYNNVAIPLSVDVKYEIATRAIRSNVIKIYSSLVERKDFYEFIKINALNNSLLTGEKELKIDSSDEFKEMFKKFRNANATSAFILLLYLLRNQIPFEFDNSEMLDLFEITLRFFIRRNLTNNPSTGAIPQLLMDIIEEINKLSNPKSFDSVREIILDAYKEKTSPNNVVEDVIRGDIYDTNRDMARYLLCSLCKNSDNNEKQLVDLWAKKDNKYIWTIEHILPEGNKNADNIPDKWLDMIRSQKEYSTLSNEEITSLIKKYRHKIGNLTMTGYNASLGQLEFSKKKDRFDQNKNSIGYNNGLNLNDYVYNQQSWLISNIVERTDKLTLQIMENLDII